MNWCRSPPSARPTRRHCAMATPRARTARWPRRSRPSRRASWRSASDPASASAIYLDKRFETVIAAFGTAAAGGVFVPVNPLLKAEQVGYILRDCNVRVLVTSPERLALLRRRARRVPRPAPRGRRQRRGDAAPAPRQVAVHRLGRAARRAARTPATASSTPTWRRSSTPRAAPASPRASCCPTATWSPARRASRAISSNRADDTLLAALPLSFDAGFSQLTTAFHAGAARRAAQLPAAADVLNALVRERVTGLTARAAAVDPADAARVARGDRRAPALLRQHRRPHAARDAASAARSAAARRSPS